MFRFLVDTTRGRCCVCLRTSKETPSSKVTLSGFQTNPSDLIGQSGAVETVGHTHLSHMLLHQEDEEGEFNKLDLNLNLLEM